MFLTPNFIDGEPPEFLDLHYKIDTGSDHVAKFRGDRPRDLGERVAKKNNGQNRRPPVLTYGRPNEPRKHKGYTEVQLVQC